MYFLVQCSLCPMICAYVANFMVNIQQWGRLNSISNNYQFPSLHCQVRSSFNLSKTECSCIKFCHTSYVSTSTTFHVFVVQTPCNGCWESKNLWSGGLPHTRPSCQMLVQYLITRNTLILFLVTQPTIFIRVISLWLKLDHPNLITAFPDSCYM